MEIVLNENYLGDIINGTCFKLIDHGSVSNDTYINTNHIKDALKGVVCLNTGEFLELDVDTLVLIVDAKVIYGK
ncbi:MAG: hypothetical protein WC783_00040 [Candidatus Paceibacterota bacterium]|jgi:hypothetical protein